MFVLCVHLRLAFALIEDLLYIDLPKHSNYQNVVAFCFKQSHYRNADGHRTAWRDSQLHLR
jgi:hypothetical protein